MSSLPTPSHMSGVGGGRTHRHRRSGAISGDFDAMGLGLFPSPPISLSFLSNQAVMQNDELDRHFHFDNNEDFTNKPVSTSFSFPSESPDFSQPTSPQHSLASPIRRPKPSSVLNSPIKMAPQSRIHSLCGSPLHKFFMTEETNIDAENVPDALIDLDEVMNTNSQTGDHGVATSQDDFLASPFAKPHTSPFMSSPLSIQNTTLVHQPIPETRADDIAEELEENLSEYVADDDEIFTHAPNTLTDFYYNGSCNSSSSSLRSFTTRATAQAIEKTFSNGSKDSYNSGQNQSSMGSLNTPPSKRSGAMANRYQSFYDQSYKISNALKVSSSDSVNLTSTASNEVSNSDSKEKTLGHLKSFQSLKSAPVKRVGSKGTLRFQDSRAPFAANLASDSSGSGRPSVLLRAVTKTKPNLEKPVANKSHSESAEQTLSALADPLQVSGKISSNSPNSLKSETASTVLSANSTVQSTDHSSLLSSGDHSFKARSMSSFYDDKQSKTPSIVISADGEETSSPSTDTTSQQFPESFAVEEVSGSSRSTVTGDLRSSRNSPNKSPRRTASPNELAFMRNAQNPTCPYKDLTVANHKVSHRKSRSMSLLLHRSFSVTTNDEALVEMLERKHRRFRDWFKKYNV